MRAGIAAGPHSRPSRIRGVMPCLAATRLPADDGGRGLAACPTCGALPSASASQEVVPNPRKDGSHIRNAAMPWPRSSRRQIRGRPGPGTVMPPLHGPFGPEWTLILPMAAALPLADGACWHSLRTASRHWQDRPVGLPAVKSPSCFAACVQPETCRPLPCAAWQRASCDACCAARAMRCHAFRRLVATGSRAFRPQIHHLKTVPKHCFRRAGNLVSRFGS